MVTLTQIHNEYRTNYITGGTLNKDGRGRVRFGHGSRRFEATKKGMAVYYRSSIGNWKCEQRAVALGRAALAQDDLTNVKLLRTLANAVELAQS